MRKPSILEVISGWTVFFMMKYWKRILICLMIALLCWTGGLLRDRNLLKKELVRLHVVGASDSLEDQSVKLQVRDAVLKSLKEEMQNLTDTEEALAYLQVHLPQIEAVANEVLETAGFADRVRVSLGEEMFPVRNYDTFSLPSGIYQTLRIVIGPGAGQNWWCVAFPELCVGAAAEDFQEAASCAGFSPMLTETLDAEPGYEIRFYFLDLLGRLENLLLGE